MGLWSAIKSAASGEFSEAGNMLFMSEDDISTQEQVNNAQQAIVARQYAQGVIDEKEASQMTQQIQLNAYPELFKTEGSPMGAFADSIKQTTSTFTKGVASGLSGIMGGIAKMIPLWLWVIIAIGAIIYFMPLIRAAGFMRPKG